MTHHNTPQLVLVSLVPLLVYPLLLLACEVHHITSHRNNHVYLLLLLLLLLLPPGSNECVARNFSHDSVVCECNSTYCDSVGSATLPPLGQYSSYLTSMAGSRLEAGQGQVQTNSTGAGE